jgi:hypothetical protein
METDCSQTRVTTSYHIKNPDRKAKKRKAAAANDTEATASASEPQKTAPPRTHRGQLELRTYDPKSGTILKYRTSKAAEVTHLIQMMHTLARTMAALPPKSTAVVEDVAMADAPADSGRGSGTQTPVPAATLGPQQGGGKGKKKKGKK